MYGKHKTKFLRLLNRSRAGKSRYNYIITNFCKKQGFCPCRPKGWTLPSTEQTQTIGNGTDNYVPAFSPTLGGFYYNGSPGYIATRGIWWSSTMYDTVIRYILSYNSTNLYISDGYRYYGFYIRCVQAS